MKKSRIYETAIIMLIAVRTDYESTDRDCERQDELSS